MARSLEESLLPLLAEFARTGDPQIGDRIVAATVELVDHIAQRYRFAGEPVEDLQQEARLGLLQASRSFDPRRGVKFTTYAGHAIQGAIQHYLRDKGKLIREPGWLHDLSQKVSKAAARLRQQLGREPDAAELAAELQVPAEQVAEVLRTRELFRVSSLEQPGGDDPEESPVSDEDKVGAVDGAPLLPVADQVALTTALGALRPLERSIIEGFFFQDRSKAAIAAQLGCPPAKVSALLRRALRELRELMLSGGDEPGTMLLRQRRADLELFAERARDAERVDALTGLPTRGELTERLAEEIARSRRCDYELSVCLMQLQDLGAYAAHRGRREADRVCCQVADVLRRSSRRSDLIGRFDAVRFAFVLPHTGPTASVLIERCRSGLGALWNGAPELALRAGLAVHPRDGATVEALFGQAAGRLAAAVADGGGRASAA